MSPLNDDWTRYRVPDCEPPTAPPPKPADSRSAVVPPNIAALLAENQRYEKALEWLRSVHAQDTNRWIIENIEKARAENQRLDAERDMLRRSLELEMAEKQRLREALETVQGDVYLWRLREINTDKAMDAIDKSVSVLDMYREELAGDAE